MHRNSLNFTLSMTIMLNKKNISQEFVFSETWLLKFNLIRPLNFLSVHIGYTKLIKINETKDIYYYYISSTFDFNYLIQIKCNIIK